ncbi:hypothetical protein BH11PSE2_BH11PSE2_13230 [soil metagenome]
MGRRRPQAFLIRLALLVGAAIACAALAVQPAPAQPPREPPLRAARWVAGGEPARVLTEQPTECLAAPADPTLAWSVEVGRAVFRSPTFLGGQAARAGIACETCHRNGRSNPNFAFPGVSGEPGTADVTSSLFSSHRGDGQDNPRPIPDLSRPPGAFKISRSADSADLQAFVHGLVTEEFDGHEPPAAALKGLADYVRQISASACPAGLVQPLTPAAALEDARRAVRAAQKAIGFNDNDTALALVDAARSTLGLIDERYGARGLEKERNLLRTASLDLGSAQSAVRRGVNAGVMLDLWLARSAGLQAALEKSQARSYYNRDVLAVALGG